MVTKKKAKGKAKKKVDKGTDLNKDEQKIALLITISKATQWYSSLSMEEQLLVIARQYAKIHEIQIPGVNMETVSIEMMNATEEIMAMYGPQKDEDEALRYIG